MVWLVAGLALFLGAHSAQIFASGWREGLVRRLGAGPWKGLYSLVSLTGFGLIIFGYGQARGAALRPAAGPCPLHIRPGLVGLHLRRCRLLARQSHQALAGRSHGVRRRTLGARASAGERHAGGAGPLRRLSSLGDRGLCLPAQAIRNHCCCAGQGPEHRIGFHRWLDPGRSFRNLAAQVADRGLPARLGAASELRSATSATHPKTFGWSTCEPQPAASLQMALPTLAER